MILKKRLLTLALILLLLPCGAASASSVNTYNYAWPVDAAWEVDVGYIGLDGSSTGGITFYMAPGQPVFAVRAGTVLESYTVSGGTVLRTAEDTQDAMGNTIVIDHGNGAVTYYCNLRAGFAVKAGDTVVQGQQIALSGNTGSVDTNPQGGQLHFEFFWNTNRQNPEDYLTRANVTPVYHNPFLGFEEAASPAPGQLYVKGWSYDPDNIGATIEISVYAGTASALGTKIATIKAEQSRPDIHAQYQCGSNHGFEGTFTLPKEMEGKQYVIRVVAANVDVGRDTETDTPLAVEIQKDTTPPEFTSVNVTGLSANGYTVRFSVTDDAEVASVQARSWTGTLTGAAAWQNVEQSGGEWTLRVLRSGEKEQWHTELRAYDTAGNQSATIQIYLRYLIATFQPNGGVCSTQSMPVFNVFYLTDYSSQVFLSTYGSLPTATWAGHTFAGWYTRQTGGAQVNPATRVSAESDHTLYAHWIQDDVEAPEVTNVSVTGLSANGYTVAAVITDNVGVTNVTMPSWVGTYTSAVPQTEASQSGDVWSRTVAREGESGIWHTEIHASDAAGNQAPTIGVYLRRLTVSFDAAGGVCPTSKKEVFNVFYLTDYRNQTYISPYGELPTPTRDNFAFVGWYTAASGGERVDSATEVRAVTNHTLYAHWTGTSQPLPTDPDSALIEAGSATGRPGSTVEIPVTVSHNPGVISMLLNLEYDNSVLTLTKVDATRLIGDFQGSQTLTAMPYRLSWADDYATANHTDDGLLVTLTFDISPNAAEGDYPISLSYNNNQQDIYNVDLKTVEFSVTHGSVRVSRALIGDVNKDGLVTTMDRLYIARHVAGWSGYGDTDIDMVAADVNADGYVTGMDRTILTRHLLGWSGYEQLPYTMPAFLASAETAAVPMIHVSSQTVGRGEIAKITLSLEGNPGIIAMNLLVRFDEDLELIQVENAGILEVNTMSPDLGNPYSLTLGNDTATVDSTANGVLATLYFRLPENAQARTYPIAISYRPLEIYNSQLQPVAFDIPNEGAVILAAEADTPYAIGTISKAAGGVQVSITAPSGSASAFCAAYDNSRRMVAVAPARSVSGSGTYTFSLGDAAYDTVRIFLLDSKGKPLCSAVGGVPS